MLPVVAALLLRTPGALAPHRNLYQPGENVQRLSRVQGGALGKQYNSPNPSVPHVSENLFFKKRKRNLVYMLLCSF